MLWLNITNGNDLGGGKPVLTGPSFVDSDQHRQDPALHREQHPVVAPSGEPAPAAPPAGPAGLLRDRIAGGPSTAMQLSAGRPDPLSWSSHELSRDDAGHAAAHRPRSA